MDSLIYSLNATLPVFLVIVVGYVLKQIGILNDGFVKTANKFNFVVTLPVLLFVDLSTTDIIGDFDITYVLYCALVTTVAFFGLWIAAKFLIKDKKIVGEFVQAGYRSSAAILGVAFIQNIYGDSGMAPVMIIGCVPLFNIFAVLVLTFEGKKDGNGKDNIINSLINIVKNPIIIGIFLGMIVACTGLKIPAIPLKAINSVAATATPIALIVVGAGFEGKKAIAKTGPTLVAVFIKLIVLPLIFLPVAVKMGFRREALVAIIIMLGSPTTVTCYIMAKNMNNDEVLSGSIVVLATLLSSFTLTGLVFLMRYMGWI